MDIYFNPLLLYLNARVFLFELLPSFTDFSIIEKNGEQCKCGNRGCFEAYCSKRKFKQEMQEILKIDRYVWAKELTEEIE